jgi:hypothetical protein
MIRAMVIGPDELARIAAVVAHAEKHRFGEAVLEKIAAGLAMPSEEALDRFRVEIPVGYLAGFTIDWARHRADYGPGWVRHLTVGLLDAPPGLTPNPHAIAELLPLFGFKWTLEECVVCPDADRHVVHVAEPLEAEAGGPGDAS